MKTKNIYRLPVPQDAISLTVYDTPSHQGAYEGSIDFAVAVNTPVFAAADGEVIRVRDDSLNHGDDPEYGQEANYISLFHANNEVSEYLHLAAGSALVKVGDQVKAGQVIAKTGLSGWLTAPHLHFMVYKRASSKKDFQCLDIRLGQAVESSA